MSVDLLWPIYHEAPGGVLGFVERNHWCKKSDALGGIGFDEVPNVTPIVVAAEPPFSTERLRLLQVYFYRDLYR